MSVSTSLHTPRAEIHIPGPDFLTTAEYCHIRRISSHAECRRRQSGDCPTYIRIGRSRRVYYVRAAVEDYLNGRPQRESYPVSFIPGDTSESEAQRVAQEAATRDLLAAVGEPATAGV